MIAPSPLTYDVWRRIKAATRHRRYLERPAEADEAGADDWLALLDPATAPGVQRGFIDADDPWFEHQRTIARAEVTT